jgi:hypothetical protein
MKLNYFPETDSLYIDLSEQPGTEVGAPRELEYRNSPCSTHRPRRVRLRCSPWGRRYLHLCRSEPGTRYRE